MTDRVKVVVAWERLSCERFAWTFLKGLGGNPFSTKEQEENMKSKNYVSEVKDVGRVISDSGNYRQGTQCVVVLWMREDHRILQLKAWFQVLELLGEIKRCGECVSLRVGLWGFRSPNHAHSASYKCIELWALSSCYGTMPACLDFCLPVWLTPWFLP